MESGKEEFKWAYGYGKPLPEEYIIEVDTNYDWYKLLEEVDKNSIDLEDKSDDEDNYKELD